MSRRKREPIPDDFIEKNIGRMIDIARTHPTFTCQEVRRLLPGDPRPDWVNRLVRSLEGYGYPIEQVTQPQVGMQRVGKAVYRLSARPPDHRPPAPGKLSAGPRSRRRQVTVLARRVDEAEFKVIGTTKKAPSGDLAVTFARLPEIGLVEAILNGGAQVQFVDETGGELAVYEVGLEANLVGKEDPAPPDLPNLDEMIS